MSYVIEVDKLYKTFGRKASWLSPARHQVQAVKGVSLQLSAGETLAVVGESGSGKSTLARMLVGLETPTSGSIRLMGESAQQRDAKALGRLIQYVFQDPVASLNPRKTIADILNVPLSHLCGYRATQRKNRMLELMEAVQMPADALLGYPHEFSGGQAQRLAIARALAAEARILVLDEPVSALDVSVQAQVLLLLDQLKQQFGLSYLFISHDLAVVESIADRVAVMYRGDLVECADNDALFRAPQHSYTQSLLASAPRL
ncbi:ATP-binding cassette domain-containing protein [Erwiniaceae bacterium BAC15a-03b]|uniref:ATP-binding cassette domain-containing protein n=1 Tax=Winslowiella arboricola TaxID=2978220 RepID=A0A9J6PQ91_9GAMM|nr:ATP-binding cassette domain-containing protein [Winslowiella arboricola]MCU5774347.1 ATP-binding cassette domain-containing protein [Winslowiella arboricola]MCU5778894.1 ATP-binding cassette domain-containing protein [Winslowiella arboricola]